MDYLFGRHNRNGSSDYNDQENHYVHNHGSANRLENISRKQTYKICTKAGDGFSVAVRENKVVLVHSDDHQDTQHWYKDERFVSKEKDEQGQRCFALVNKATGQVMKHSVVGEPVTLVPCDPEDGLELSVLWTESEDVGDGFKIIRLVNNIKLCMDAFHGHRDHGGVKDGTHIAVYECWNGENQQWKIVPYSNAWQDVVEVPDDFVLETPALRKTLEQVVKEVDEEQKKREECHTETWEMINFGIPRQQSAESASDVDVHQGGENIQPEQLVRQRLGKMVLNPMLETRTDDTIFIPQWEITTDDCLTDAFSERSIALCHQWSKEIVPPKDYKELLALELKELYHWADYHKAQAHIFEMTAREKANLMFLNEQTLREAAEKRLSELEETSFKQVSPKSVFTTDNITTLTGPEQVEAAEKLEEEKAELMEKLRDVEMKCLEQESRFKDLEEQSSQLTTLKNKIPQLLKKKMEIVIKAIMKRHQDLDWNSIYDDIEKMDTKLDALSKQMTADLEAGKFAPGSSIIDQQINES